MWCVRELAHNTIAVGYFSKNGIQIYEGKNPTRFIKVPGNIFALVMPPFSAEPQDTDGGMPSKIIAMDNERYYTVDLTDRSESTNTPSSDGLQPSAVAICSIGTGIGGYMPRYVTRKIEDQPGNFALTTMIQN